MYLVEISEHPKNQNYKENNVTMLMRRMTGNVNIYVLYLYFGIDKRKKEKKSILFLSAKVVFFLRNSQISFGKVVCSL